MAGETRGPHPRTLTGSGGLYAVSYSRVARTGVWLSFLPGLHGRRLATGRGGLAMTAPPSHGGSQLGRMSGRRLSERTGLPTTRVRQRGGSERTPCHGLPLHADVRLELAFDELARHGCHERKDSANARSIGKSRFRQQPWPRIEHGLNTDRDKPMTMRPDASSGNCSEDER
jgi:hypothetical protein